MVTRPGVNRISNAPPGPPGGLPVKYGCCAHGSGRPARACTACRQRSPTSALYSGGRSQAPDRGGAAPGGAGVGGASTNGGVKGVHEPAMSGKPFKDSYVMLD